MERIAYFTQDRYIACYISRARGGLDQGQSCSSSQCHVYWLSDGTNFHLNLSFLIFPGPSSWIYSTSSGLITTTLKFFLATGSVRSTSPFPPFCSSGAGPDFGEPGRACLNVSITQLAQGQCTALPLYYKHTSHARRQVGKLSGHLLFPTPRLVRIFS